MKSVVILVGMVFILLSCEKQELVSLNVDQKVTKIEEAWVTDDIILAAKKELIQEEIKEPVEKYEWEKYLNKNIKAPDLIGLTNWINWEEIKSLEELKWKVVFIDFWTYICINCVRTLPHMQALHEKYKDEWLVILWVHAPEFSYDRKIENVVAAVKKHGLTYRVVQDNDFKTWRNYKNRYWPAQYIINKQWILRYTHFWEWAYEKIDKVVEFLLSE